MTACDAVRELLAAHVLEALASTEATLVRDHLRDCAPCREAEAQARADLAVIEAPDVSPPAIAWTRIRQRIAAAQAGDEPVRAQEAHDPTALIAVSCSFCRGTLARADSVYCASCLAPHHPDCWREYGRCSVMGCAEERVVRPTERPDVAPNPVSVPPGKDGKLVPFDEVRRRRRSRRLLGGGLFVAITGGLAAAGLRPIDPPSLQLADIADTRDPIVVATSSPTPAPEPRWDVLARDASLGELCAALEREAGARIDLSAGLTDALVRDGRWRARTWRELLRELATEHGLVLREDPSRVGLSGEADERATATLEQQTTQLLELGRWRLTDLRSGPAHQIAVAPTSLAFALVEGRTVRVLARGHDASFTFKSRVALATWRDDGARLAIVCEAEVVVLEVDESGPPSIVDRRPLDGEPVRYAAWAPGAARPTLTSWTRFFSPGSDPSVFDQERLVRRLVEPLSDTTSIEVTYGSGAFTTGDGPPSQLLGPGWKFQVPTSAPRIDLDLGRSRLLVIGTDIRLHDTATGKQLGETIARRATSTFSGDLAPDGARVAWIDGGLLFVRRLAADGSTDGVDAQVLAHGSSEAVVGCAWRGDGHALALWTSRGEVAVIETTALDRGGTIPAEVQLEQADVGYVRWVGDALVVASTRTVPRSAQVQVLPSGQAPRETDLKIDVEWTPDGSARPDIFAVPPPAPEEVPSPTVTELPPTRTVPDPPPPLPLDDPPAPPEPIPPSLAHVRVGQRYLFTGSSGEVRTWEVLEVSAKGVVYSQSVSLNGTTFDQPTRHTWTPQHPERVLQATKERRERRTVGGVAFDCVVTEVGDAVTWTAVEGSWTAFPGVVRNERGGRLMSELTGVE